MGYRDFDDELIDDAVKFLKSNNPRNKFEDSIIKELLGVGSRNISNQKFKGLERKLYSYGLKKIKELEEENVYSIYRGDVLFYMGLVAEKLFWITKDLRWTTNLVKDIYASLDCYSELGSKRNFISNLMIVNSCKYVFNNLNENCIWEEIKFKSEVNLAHHHEYLCQKNTYNSMDNLVKSIHNYAFAADCAKYIGRRLKHKGYIEESIELYETALEKGKDISDKITYFDNLEISLYQMSKLLEKVRDDNREIPNIEDLFKILDNNFPANRNII